MNKLCVITTTIGTLSDAKKLVKILLEKRLIACAQMQEITSSYWWDNRIENGKEYLINMKTKASLYPEIEETIIKNHPYEIPEIFMVEIEDGYYQYLNWIKDETTNPKVDL